MSKLLIFGALAVVLSVSSASVMAQSGNASCGCCGAVQPYQRFSYQPAYSPQPMISSTQSQVMPSQVMNAQPGASSTSPAASIASNAPMVVQQSVVGAPAQSFRRFSHQPTSGIGQRKALWEYSKGDERRYRP